ncbi:ubiquinol-cytochrome c reductase iron-sulfur subunit [Amnibacterium kyonggiense]|uniref:Cytochrome bc1 complex Rieske iron-sulfur subunit n=1 Tax=Amnibacterium kyonggiense TaxID=595671 RepID=A0A4R7FL12_9MICO|nr:Rieske 2Fe-2S domain-containing protein [Amnibacterium kyonggiense]TDS77047.1 menaquinol-cytochrome c reductase iron-sulfur subunit precursor [Amnibacterium kyonggiense]
MASNEPTDIVPADDHGTTFTDPGTAVERADAFQNPGLPPHQLRVTDKDPKAAKRAERVIVLLFYVSVIGSVFAMAAYFAFPIKPNDLGSVRLNNVFIGLGLAFALLAIGIAAIHWSKALMDDHEGIDIRHPVAGPPPVQARAVEIFRQADRESGFNRRVLIRNGMIAAIAALPFPAIFLFRDLAPAAGTPAEAYSHTLWKQGTRLTKDPTGDPILASDVTIGSVFHVIPDGLLKSDDMLEEKGKAAVLLMRLEPGDLHVSPDRKTWNYDGIVAYSKICTHVGCPVALYEQQTHHLLCPCHQSQFDITREAAVIFGPAVRPLPQLPITVDSEGYLVAQSDFHEPVGPSFWERRGDYNV